MKIVITLLAENDGELKEMVIPFPRNRALDGSVEKFYDVLVSQAEVMKTLFDAVTGL